jgi:hypothetical protein
VLLQPVIVLPGCLLAEARTGGKAHVGSMTGGGKAPVGSMTGGGKAHVGSMTGGGTAHVGSMTGGGTAYVGSMTHSLPINSLGTLLDINTISLKPPTIQIIQIAACRGPGVFRGYVQAHLLE